MLAPKSNCLLSDHAARPQGIVLAWQALLGLLQLEGAFVGLGATA